jgi:zinc transporter ZupT
MNSLVILFTSITFFSTLIGGLVIFKFRKHLPYFFAFAAGSLVAVSFLDLLPESLNISQSINLPVRYIMLSVVASFFIYSLLERFFLTHHMGDHDPHGHIMGPIGAGSLILHSFFDGAAIGSAFMVNVSVGIVVALAVIFHDFTDGINTVIVMLRNKQKIRNAILFLLMDALAPVIGVLAISSMPLPQSALAILLAVFVGEFLYIGASTLMPETRKNLSKGIVVAMLIGIILIAILTSLV